MQDSSKMLPKKTLSYICNAVVARGKFDPVKAKALGIKPGKKFSILANGTPVESDLNPGVMIRPDQVLDKPLPPKVMIIIDCPSVEYIHSITSSSKFESLYNNNNVAVIVHILGDSVVSDQVYIDWMNKFSEDPRHIICNEQYNAYETIMRRSKTLFTTLASLDSDMFPELYETVVPSKDLSQGIYIYLFATTYESFL